MLLDRDSPLLSFGYSAYCYYVAILLVCFDFLHFLVVKQIFLFFSEANIEMYLFLSDMRSLPGIIRRIMQVHNFDCSIFGDLFSKI